MKLQNREESYLPATKKQEGLIEQILQDFPDSVDLHEYGDYRQNPTRENASEFIGQALETHSGELAQREKYLSYIPCRPLIFCPCSPQAGPGG